MNEQSITSESDSLSITAPGFTSFLHDLTNPLTLVQFNLGILHSKLSATEKHEYSQLLESALIGIRHANKMVIAIKRELNKSFSAREELEKICILYQQKIKLEGIHLDMNLSADNVFQDNKEEFQRIIINLISNALDVLAIKQEVPKYLTIESMIEDDLFVLKIQDNGQGMTKQELEKVFSEKFTTKLDGSGLGLSIVKDYICSIFRGEVECQSIKDVGTTFVLKFPLPQII